MGMTVAIELLVAIYPIQTSLETVKQDLLVLQASRFLLPGETPSTWTFATVIIRHCNPKIRLTPGLTQP